MGLAQHRPLVRTLGTFDDRPDWALLSDSTVVQVTHSASTTKPVLAALDPLLSNQETTPALLRLAGATVVAGIRDAVWTSTGSLDGGQALLSPRVRPAAGFDLEVLTVRDTGDGGVASFTGYAVANQKLFRLDAPRASVVRAVEVQLEEPVAFVWYQGDAARVVSSSGRVRTLPGGALVQATELPGEIAAVGALCGAAYLLLDPVVAGLEKSAPLLRLVPGADGRGAWAKVELEGGERLEAGEALGARMLRAGDTLWLTSKHGVTWRLDAPDGGCR